MKKILYDCDPGIDDGIAIILAINSEKIKIEAITTVFGNSPVEKTTLNACRLLDYLGQDIEVCAGAKKPLNELDTKFSEGKVDASSVDIHGKDGLGDSSLLTKTSSRKLVNKLAYKFIIEKVKQGIDTIVATGPLTNIALAFKENPEIMNKLRELIIMGGVINQEGNIGRLAEFNFYADPAAADYVLNNTKVPILLIPLNATHKAIFSDLDRKNLKDTKTGKLVKSMLEKYQKIYIDSGMNGNPLHDPLAMYYLINPKIFTMKKMHINVEFQGKYTRGVCVPEFRKWINVKPNCDVAVDINHKEFKQAFVSIIEGK